MDSAQLLGGGRQVEEDASLLVDLEDDALRVVDQNRLRRNREECAAEIQLLRGRALRTAEEEK